MLLTLPNLDDLRWQDLVEEGRSLIPAYAPEWTNHNPSDPGITLMELLAYASEQLMYQNDRITDANVRKFLDLIGGKRRGHKSEKNLTQQKRAVVRNLRDFRRAVTIEDFEELARNVHTPNGNEHVGRAICIPGVNLEAQDPEDVAVAPGHVSLIIVPGKQLQPKRDLLFAVRDALEPARLLTTRLHVVGPQYVEIGVRMTLVLRGGSSVDQIKKDVIKKVEEFFDPLTGWIDKKGWPLGRSVYASELYQLLGDIEGIELAQPTRDAAGTALDEFVLSPAEAARVKRNVRGELEGIELRSHELAKVSLTAEDLTIAPRA